MADNLPRVGSALLVRDEANKILLGQRNKDPQRGCWVLPGGKIHAFEKIAAAAARELREETGLDVEVGDHFGVYEIINPPNEHRIVIYSWAKVTGGVAKASDDLSDLRFFAIEELGSVPLTPLVKTVLKDAGLIRGKSPNQMLQKPVQLVLVPIPIGGASSANVKNHPPARTLSRRRARHLVEKTRLLFDSTARL